MNKIVVSGKEFVIINGRQILNMGGPWVGTLKIGDKVISNDCIVDNFVFFESKKLLFFVKFHVITEFYYYFTINFYNIDHQKVFEFMREFDMVYIKQFINENELEIYHAFHDKISSSKEIFYLNSEDFN